MMKKINVLIANHHKDSRESWTSILDSDSRFRVIGGSDSGEEAVKMTGQLLPDVVLMGINHPGIDPRQATKQIIERWRKSKILGIAQSADPVFAKKIIESGAMGCLTEHASPRELFEAVMEVHHNRRFISAEIKNTLTRKVFLDNLSANRFAPLTDLEMQVLLLIKKNRAPGKIAAKLLIARKTVLTLQRYIMNKLGLKNKSALLHFIRENAIYFE